MNQREKVLARRKAILKAVKAGGATVKSIAKLTGDSTSTITKSIHDIGDIHWQDTVLYYGERL